MKKRVITIAAMLMVISIMTSACVISTEKKSKEKEDTTAEQKEPDDEEETTKATSEASEDAKAASDDSETAPASTDTAETTEAAPETTTAAIPQEDCELIIDVTYEDNYVLAKYSINLYLDGEKIDTMENGRYYLTKVDTVTGDHEVKFEKRGDSDFETTAKVTIAGDSTLIFEIKSHLDEIEIKSSRVVDGLQEMEVEMPDVTEMRLDKAIEAVEAAGFKNISTKSDKTIILKSNWVVIEQSVAAGQKANRSTEIILTCEKDG